MTRRTRCKSAVVFAPLFTALVLVPPAVGVVLHPGETVPLAGTTSAIRPDIGEPVVDTRDAAFGFDWNGTPVTGTVSQRVRGFQPGGLLVDYRISAFDDHGLGMRIESLTTQGYFPYMVPYLDADFRLDEAGVVSPTSASAANDSGVTVRFDFGSGPLLAGETSRWMFVGDPSNDLYEFGNWGAQVLVRAPDGTGVSAPFQSYSTYIPAPASASAFALGLLPLVARRRRS